MVFDFRFTQLNLNLKRERVQQPVDLKNPLSLRFNLLS